MIALLFALGAAAAALFVREHHKMTQPPTPPARRSLFRNKTIYLP